MLSKPLDFLKIGHHGSENATPWSDDLNGPPAEPAQILDAILPVPAGGNKPTALAVVSTERSKYKTIPRGALLVELGSRVAGAKNYKDEFDRRGLQVSELPKFEELEKSFIDSPQPLRTDLERLLGSPGYVEVKIGP
ncbi:hypothetical protein O7A70_19920 [Mesorhizobium sp. Cs1299R1N1]|uniref:hypothetical protein n=1 Tax=Mesorhizobium sp. Cs1299R1N1 TaxID=3015172 RepID=UPI00301BEBC4